MHVLTGFCKDSHILESHACSRLEHAGALTQKEQLCQVFVDIEGILVAIATENLLYQWMSELI